jgi:hypothetical protein
MTFCGDRGDGYFSERIIDFIHSFKYLVTSNSSETGIK